MIISVRILRAQVMNAVIHERITRAKHEAHMLTNDAIEVHLQYIRSGLDSVNTKIEGHSAQLRALTDSVAGLRAMQKAILWVLGLGTFLPIGFTIAKALSWI